MNQKAYGSYEGKLELLKASWSNDDCMIGFTWDEDQIVKATS